LPRVGMVRVMFYGSLRCLPELLLCVWWLNFGPCSPGGGIAAFW
jgi:hypothetical protein